MRRLPGLLLLLLLVPTSACDDGRPPSSSCVAFVACVAARDVVRGTSTNVDRFLEGGACWTAAEEGASSCDTACARGLAVLAASPDAPEVCR